MYPSPYNATSPPAVHRATSAASAAAAFRRSSAVSNSNTPRRQSNSSNSGATPTAHSVSRQGSVETDREGSVPNNPTTEENEEANNNAQPESQQQPEADAEDDDENKEDLLAADMDAYMQAQMEKQKEDMKLLLENFSNDQLQRYEAYRRSALNRTNVRRLVSQVLNQQCSQTMAIVVAGFSKVYVGEIIEKAREVMEEWEDAGAIRPEHLREAHRRYKLEREAQSNVGKTLFRR
ncbi:transcription initiation factor tfiid subunit11 [Lichtheimia corymbifera JMRC:FSU:9682]|uniref:Transcription initiation factor TFIID subunit 11 n=1 Tax=Lichtheimia corymbifera JMRC:FSU:9682 TaxID=1263082 RepID=A0A068RMZ9_9FUNG|nr:transcription initiation factor tfiid subunit11 [Lichtheimia corymbifera JMRC:FSU:9682]